MCTADELNLVFDETGKQFGYLTVRAEFAEMKEFKVKWQRGHDWIDLMIPDYLEDAPSEVLEDLAQTVFSKIAGKERGYGKVMRSFVKDRRFAENNRRKYLERTDMMMSGPHGEVYDLQEIYGDLVRRGLLDNIKDIHLTWSSDEERPFRISALMKVASFSYLMDLKSTPKEVIEVMIYEAVRLIAAGEQHGLLIQFYENLFPYDWGTIIPKSLNFEERKSAYERDSRYLA